MQKNKNDGESLDLIWTRCGQVDQRDPGKEAEDQDHSPLTVSVYCKGKGNAVLLNSRIYLIYIYIYIPMTSFKLGQLNLYPI